jgi:hypothetical protein
VDVNQAIGEGRLENAGKVIGTGKPDKNGDQNQEHHAREK